MKRPIQVEHMETNWMWPMNNTMTVVDGMNETVSHTHTHTRLVSRRVRVTKIYIIEWSGYPTATVSTSAATATATTAKAKIHSRDSS